MSANIGWPLPFWTKSDVDFIISGLNSSHEFLTQQNARHADVGTVHLVNRVSTSLRISMWFMMMATVAAVVWLVLELSRWSKVHGTRISATKTKIEYQPLLMHAIKTE